MTARLPAASPISRSRAREDASGDRGGCRREALIDDVLKLPSRYPIEDLPSRPGKIEGPRTAAEQLLATDKDAFNALGTCRVGRLLHVAEGPAHLGYPGQESVTYDPYATPDYLTDGMLERVVARGPIYRSTPR